jgi:uncharacterized protein (TIGR01370 family)
MTRFLVYYGTADDPEIGACDVVVLDAEAGGALLARRREGAVFLGYVSLGEADSRRAHFPAVAGQGLLVEPNPNWPDAWFVDLRDERWRRLVLEELVPAVLDRGFHGVFLDTLDDAEFLERRDPARFAGMVEQAADLVRSLRRRYPQAKIMVNRGYALLPRIAGQFDMLLGESVRATCSREGGTCSLLPAAEYEWQRERMWEARRLHPALRLFSLDYWDPDDAEGIARIYAEQRDNGFVPYVATPDLARVVPAPGRVHP